MSRKIRKRARKIRVTIVKDMPDLSKDPYFVKKNEKAKAIIEKYGTGFDKHK